ncbi:MULTISPECIES: chemotaxis protein CheB [unclassified Janthinobacterium]|uniref:chemotaxis protein CheB n=1 Tax=unclassified Janthinobacterium TaxID=2610881 RepID=UPI001E3C7524|nr:MULTISPECIES: chemotaxis protein CheB [unclassified Janthinobacterium]MCC7645446.1 chemotaxis protein CheB [Janthinobacterium sp. EB271-G4-3-1]MCC7689619.1 chemotaxis protein CheB [Janthinobacterium sp. EB271-G4-3-2]
METLIVMGASVGGVSALSTIFAALPANLPAAILAVMHVGARNSVLPEILGKTSALPVRFAEEREPVRAGRILLAPPDRHMLVANLAGQAMVELTRGPKENHTRPAIDPLFRTAAAAFGPKVVGVILSGYLDDGTAGLQAIKACGGKALVQEPQDAVAPSMPQSAIDHAGVDWRLPCAEIGPALLALASAAPAPAGAAQSLPPVPQWVAVENRFARGVGNMEQLEKIATPSTFTCPECQGTLWELHGRKPQRFRCHTGHSFTAQTLGELQHEKAEDAIWAAVRALQEKEKLYLNLAAKAQAWLYPGTASEYAAKARQAGEQAEMLKRALLA